MDLLFIAKENSLKVLNPIHTEEIRLSIEAFKTSPIYRNLCYAEELLIKPLREKDILHYGIKRKNTPNSIG